jgi:hypothetical protein
MLLNLLNFLQLIYKFLFFFQLSKTILDMHSYVTTVKLLVKKIINVLPNLLLSKNNEVVILAFSLYSTLSRFFLCK